MERINPIAPPIDHARWLLITVFMMIFLIPNWFWKTLGAVRQLTDCSFFLGQHPSHQPDILSEDESSLDGDKDKILFGSIIQRAASRHAVDPSLIRAIIFAESGYNPKAISKCGAQGLMQLMPKTANELGVVDCLNPEDNVQGGVKYFKMLLDKFNGNVHFALAAYNAGSSRVKKYQGIPPFKATQHYVRKVLKYYEIYKEQLAEETGET